MKKFFIVMGALIVALSIFGIWDTAKTKKENEERAKMTSVFYADVEKIEEADGKKKFTIVGIEGEEGSDEKFVGKKYTFTENKDTKALNEKGEEAKLAAFKEGSKIVIQHIGKIKEGEINELTGEVTIAPYNPATAADTTEPAEETSPTDATEETSTEAPTEATAAE